MVSCWDASPTATHDVPVISSRLKDTTISIFDTVVFTVTASDPQGIKEYLWDFNGDGVIDKTTPSKSASFAFPGTPQVVKAIVTIKDNAGDAALDTAIVTIIQDPPTALIGGP